MSNKSSSSPPLGWWRPPRFPDEDQTRVARLLHLTSWMVAVAAAVHGWFNIGGNDRLMGIFFALAAVGVGALILNRRGHQPAASAVLIFSLSVLIGAAVCFGHEGVRDAAMLLLPGNLVVAGVLLNRRQYLAVAVGILVFVAGIGVAQVQGWLPMPDPVETTHAYVLDLVVILAGTVFVIGFLAEFLRQRLNAARANAKALTLQTERLRASTEKLHALLDLAADAFFLADPAGRIVDVNRLAVELTGFQKAELVGRSLRELLPDLGAGRPTAASGTASSSLPGRLQRKDGNPLAVEVSSRVMPDAQVQAFVRDVSRRHELEAQLRQSQKMEAIGSLAGGVAHDFNNLLTVLQGHIDLLGLEPAVSPTMRESLSVMSGATQRAAELTNQLLAFSRQQVLRISTLDLAAVIDELTSLLRRTLRENIQLVWQPTRGRYWTEGDSGMLLQVLMNLAVNARDAMPNGGRLEIVLTECEAPPGRGQTATTLSARCLRITVTDTGHGIAPAVLARIGEPFFTTKEVGRGTGLGLAMAYGIVQQHQGWMEVTSEVGRGSTFTIYLPAVPAPEAEPLNPAPGLNRATGTETILVVEDEAAVRNLLTRVLERQGFTVLTAENGPAALEIWRHQHPQIRLLICDMVMPDAMNGNEVARRCRVDQPTLPIILCSGYTPESLTDELRNEPGISYLAKPFKPVELVDLIRAQLDAAAQSRPTTVSPHIS